MISYRMTIAKMEAESILANYEIFRFLVEDMKRADGSDITYEALEGLMNSSGLNPDEFAEFVENALFERKVVIEDSNPYGLLLASDGNRRKAKKEVRDDIW